MRIAAALLLLIVTMLAARATGSVTAARSEILLPVEARLEQGNQL